MQTLKIPSSFRKGDYIPDIVVGDTVPKLTFDADPTDNIDFTTCTIRMQLYANVGRTKVLDVSNGNGITVVTSKKFEVDQIPYASNPFTQEGIYIGDLEITDGSGIRLTYFRIEYSVLKQHTI